MKKSGNISRKLIEKELLIASEVITQDVTGDDAISDPGYPPFYDAKRPER